MEAWVRWRTKDAIRFAAATEIDDKRPPLRLEPQRVYPDGSTTTNFIDLYKRGCFIRETRQSLDAADVRSSAQPIPSPLGGSDSSARHGHGIRGSGAGNIAIDEIHHVRLGGEISDATDSRHRCAVNQANQAH